LFIHKRIKEIAKGVAIAAGLPEDKFPEVIIPDIFTPANYNNPDLIDKLILTSNNIIGEENVIDAEALMVGEDFSRYGLTEHKVPAALFWLGTISKEKKDSGNLPGLHSPFYYPEPKESISTGVKVMSEGLIGLFNN
jgi:hippurate hydrolase